jgi:hypothetical protein
MRITARQLGSTVVIAFFVVMIVILVMHAPGKHRTSSVTVTPSPSPTVKPSGSSATSSLAPPRSSSGSSPSPTSVAQPDQLHQEVTNFMQSFYLLEPSDTIALRRTRMLALRPPLPAGLLDQLDLNVYTTSLLDQERVSEKLTQKGIVQSIQVQPLPGHPDARNVITQIAKTDFYPEGSQAGDPQVILNASVWQVNPDGSWTCTYFAEPGDAG